MPKKNSYFSLVEKDGPNPLLNVSLQIKRGRKNYEIKFKGYGESLKIPIRDMRKNKGAIREQIYKKLSDINEKENGYGKAFYPGIRDRAIDLSSVPDKILKEAGKLKPPKEINLAVAGAIVFFLGFGIGSLLMYNAQNTTTESAIERADNATFIARKLFNEGDFSGPELEGISDDCHDLGIDLYSEEPVDTTHHWSSKLFESD